jgi:Restriction endonuclease S subunits
MSPKPLIDVRPDHWEIVHNILQKHVPDREVWAFGSRAKWSAKTYSDLDLAIIGERPLSVSVSAALEDDFTESGLPWKVDVVDLATTTPAFRSVIERDRVVIQAPHTYSLPDWPKVRIEKIAEKISIGPFGSRMKSDTYVSCGVPVIRGTNLTGGRSFSGEWVYVSEEKADELASCNTVAGDLVFPHRGAIGEVGLVPADRERYMLSSSLMMLRCNKALADSLYLYYFFKSATGQHELLKNASQVGTPGIGQPLSSLKSIELALPPLKEQRAIAHTLGALDDKIELNRRMSATLEAMARALFQDWFVDFGPVRAKMEGREPYLPAGIWQLFPKFLDEAEMPMGWQQTTLADFAILNPESWSKKSAPAEIKYVDLANTKQGTIDDVALLPWADAPSRAQRILRTGDTIVGTVRPGNKSFALVGADGMTGSTGFAVLRPKAKHCRDFVFLAATSQKNIERLSHLADGAAYPAVRPDVVLASPVAMPGVNFVERMLKGFSKTASTWLDAIEQRKRESLALAELRETLLPKLISGELRIKDAERFMEERAA